VIVRPLAVASSAATTRALWGVAASNSTVAGTVRALGARGLAALYAGTPVATLRRAGTLILADGGSQDADAALDGAFAATPFMLDGF
jgi:hypothetical protein